MTPELEKELIVGIVSSLFTALFTGIPAAALFWWTWQRDQEQLIVQKSIYRWDTESGGKVLEKDQFGPTFGIIIRNRSLFSVHVSSVGFQVDGEVIELERPLFPLKMMKNPDQGSNRPYIAADSDPREIPSQASIRVEVNDVDRPKIGAALMAAATNRGISMDDVLLNSILVVALVALETGKEFSSMTFFARIKRTLGKALLAPE